LIGEVKITRQLLAFFFATLFLNVQAQKVGVVLSGGGASGMSHIGVLKALEEKKIPVDFITGTSMGALVGACYAAGMSPKEIEDRMSDPKFIGWSKGIIEDKYQYYFKRKDPSASWISLKFSPDTVFETSLPTNFINPVAIDLALMEIFSPAIAAANFNFDSLFIPYRCVASDIQLKQPVIFKKGNLSQAVRASMSYPFYIRPITVNGRVLFDGGLYNNFPADVMYNDFNPDIIIGSDVSGNNPIPNEDNLLSQIKSMIISRNNNTHPCSNMIVVHPTSSLFGLFNFEDAKKIIEVGYKTAMASMDSIMLLVPNRKDSGILNTERLAFLNKQPQLLIDEIYIEGLNKQQAKYAKKILKLRLDKTETKVLDADRFRPNYYRLASDDKIQSLYPLAKYQSKKDLYDLYLTVKKEKKITLEFGGVFSSKPINTGYVGIQYHYLRNVAATFSANSYFGKLYGSIQAKIRLDFPTRLPFYTEVDFTNSRLDFFKSYSTFFEDVRPSYLVIYDTHSELTFGVPVSRKSKLKVSGAFGEVLNQYYQTKQFTKLDTTDRTYFDNGFIGASYERNTLDQKQFSSNGSNLSIRLKYFSGVERTYPGSTSKDGKFERYVHEWFNFRILYQDFIVRSKYYRVGYHLEGVWSNQPRFANYTATMLAAPVFAPIPESRVLFLENFRAHQFGALGIVNVFKLPRNFDYRIEVYGFQPYRRIVADPKLNAVFNPVFANRFFIGSTSLVYNSPIGPASVSFNYYNNSPKFERKIDKYSILFSFGYIIHNKKMFD
jgi:NTE family protein